MLKKVPSLRPALVEKVRLPYEADAVPEPKLMNPKGAGSGMATLVTPDTAAVQLAELGYVTRPA